MALSSESASKCDWAGLCRIYVELDNPNHPLRHAPINRETAIATAVKSGSFPVRGHRCIDSCAGGAFERIDNLMTPDAEVWVYMDTVTIALPQPGISSPLPSVFTPSPRRIKYVDVEASRGAVETWIRENALPADWISATEGKNVRQDGNPESRLGCLGARARAAHRRHRLPDTDGWRCKAGRDYVRRSAF